MVWTEWILMYTSTKTETLQAESARTPDTPRLPPPILELSTEFREILQYSKKALTTISWLKAPVGAFTKAIFVWTLWKLSRNFGYKSIRYVLKVNISGKLNWRETDSSQWSVLHLRQIFSSLAFSGICLPRFDLSLFGWKMKRRSVY